jgi:hypothetical protein
VVIDGTIYDTFDCSDRIMRCAWKISWQIDNFMINFKCIERYSTPLLNV